MSNKKNKKKQGKRISPQTVENLKLGFSTLVSNDACVTAARTWKGPIIILPICLALASVVLSVVPTMVTRFNIDASTAVFAAPYGGFDQGLANFTYSLVFDDSGVERTTPVSVKIDDNGNLVTNNLEPLYHSEAEHWYVDLDPATAKPAFEVFFNLPEFSLTDSEFFSRVDTNRHPKDGTVRSKTDDGAEIVTSQASYLAIGKTAVRMRKYSQAKSFSAIEGQYDRLHNYDFAKLSKQQAEDGSQINPVHQAYVNAVREEYVSFLRLCYETYKITGAWSYIGMMAGINAGIILLFGIVIFIMTRGKKNPCRIYTIWECLLTACYASFAPAVLSLAAGFLLAQFAFIIFMFLFGMRMMWMTMRTLRPMQA